MKNILFLDIETVPEQPEFAKLSEHGQRVFKKRFNLQFLEKEIKDMTDQDIYDQNVSLIAEFARVACASVGYVNNDNQLVMKSFCSESEVEILTKLADVISNDNFHFLCAHNGKGFDFPFLCRRYIMSGLTLPSKLNIMGAKPWDLKWLIDTQELWACGERHYPGSLDRLAYAFGLPSPKTLMDGSQVCEVFYSVDPDKLIKIAAYCEIDVETLTCVYAKMKGFNVPIIQTT